ncbi:MAG: hypothetical protein V4650_00265 [Pseudomonadota bacterium]
MLARHWLALIAVLCAAPLAQAAEGIAELRLYPAGGIASIGALWPQGRQNEVGVSVLYNRAERGDAGRHDEESGDGFGLGIEARRFKAAHRSAWFYGARIELFQLGIDWRDAGRGQGRSDITVLQPTLRGGYRFAGSGLELAASLGAEINLQTDGEAVGEGAIGLLGMAYRWSDAR